MIFLKYAVLAAFGYGMMTCSAWAAPVLVNFLPGSNISGTGSPVSVSLEISGLGDFDSPSLGAYDVTVDFDPSLLTFQSVSFGDPVLGNLLDLFSLGDIQNVTPGIGTLNLFELSLDSPGDLSALQPGNFVIATITFDTVASTNSQLGLTINALSDENGNSLLTPEPATWSLLVLGGVVIVGLSCLRAGRRTTEAHSVVQESSWRVRLAG